MRIALLAQAGSVHTDRWGTGLVQWGHTVRLFSNSSMRVTPEGVETVFLPGSSSLSYVFNLPKLRSYLRDFHPDIVHAHFASGYGLWGSCQKSAPMVLTIWGSDIEYALAGKFMKAIPVRRSLKHARIVTSASQFLIDRAILFEPSIGHKTRRVPFGVPLPGRENLSMHNNGEQDIRLIFTKQFMPTYAPDLAIRAFAMAVAEEPRLRLDMFGGGPDMESLKRLAVELKVTDRVCIEGWQANPDVAKKIRDADIMLMPSKHESYGVAALEAASYAKPVIATRVGGVPEIVHDGINGLLIDSGDCEGLTQAILKLARDPRLRQQMGEAGRSLVEKHYTLDICVRQMEEIYNEVLSR